MKTLLLALLVAVAVYAYYAAHGTAPGYYTPVADAVATRAAFNAELQLLPSPFWHEWILGNYTTAFQILRGCALRAGAARFGILVGDNTMYIETPAVKLGQSFTVIVAFKPLHTHSAVPGANSHVWRKYHPSYPYGEAVLALSTGDTIAVRMYDTNGNLRSASYSNGDRQLYSRLITTAVRGYLGADGRYTAELYVNGVFVASVQFSGERLAITSGFLLGVAGFTPPPQYMYYIAFAVYNRSLTPAEIAAWRPEFPIRAGAVMIYYADPRFVRDVDGDGVLEWLDISGNGRHAKLRGARPTWTLEPVAAELALPRCPADVSLSAEWDGHTAVWRVDGAEVARMNHAYGHIVFTGDGYAYIPITVYDWPGITIEQFVYVSPSQPYARYNKLTCIGSWYAGQNGAGICGGTPNENPVSHFYMSFYVRVGDPLTGSMKAYRITLRTGSWQHIVLTYDNVARVLRFYVNGTLVYLTSIPLDEYTVFDVPPDTAARFARLVLAANSELASTERTNIAYGYVRVYRHPLWEYEIIHNYAHPDDPMPYGLEAWVAWHSFNGTHLLDLSGKGRHARVVGTVVVYPALRWRVGAYLSYLYRHAAPLVLHRLAIYALYGSAINYASYDFATGAKSGAWDESTARGVKLTRVDGLYVDGVAVAPVDLPTLYVSDRPALGFSGRWTASDGWRGWVAVLRIGSAWLNLTQVGGHSAAAVGATVRALAGTVEAAYGDGLYVNGTKRAPLGVATAGEYAPRLFEAHNSGLRALVEAAWLGTGYGYSSNGTACGSFRCANVQRDPRYYVYADFRWWPPVASVGVLNVQSPPARLSRPDGLALQPAVVSGMPQVSEQLWGPFGEVCVGMAPDGLAYAFGVKHVWASGGAPTCVVSIPSGGSGSLERVTFNSTAPIGAFRMPPVQHPLLANSVPGLRTCGNASVFEQPYLPVRADGSAFLTDTFACAPADVAPSGVRVVRVAPGYVLLVDPLKVVRLNTSSVLYLPSPGRAAVFGYGDAVPAMSVRTRDGRQWHIYVEDGAVAVSPSVLAVPPNVSRLIRTVSGVVGVPRSPHTLVSQWWADTVRFYVQAAAAVDSEVVYISPYAGTQLAVGGELNAPEGVYMLGVLANGTYTWALPLSGPQAFVVYVPAAGYYTVRLYGEDGTKLWEKDLYLAPETRFSIGPLELAKFTPARPISLVEPLAPKPPIIAPAVSLQLPPQALGVLALAVFAAAYATFREVSLATILTGAVASVLGVLTGVAVFGAVGIVALAFGIWNKMRRQSA